MVFSDGWWFSHLFSNPIITIICQYSASYNLLFNPPGRLLLEQTQCGTTFAVLNPVENDQIHCFRHSCHPPDCLQMHMGC